MRFSFFRPENCAAAATAKTAAASLDSNENVESSNNKQPTVFEVHGKELATSSEKQVDGKSKGKLVTAATKAIKGVKEAVKKAIVKPTKKAAAILECLRNPRIITFSDCVQLETFLDDSFNERVAWPVFVYDKENTRLIAHNLSGATETSSRQYIVERMYKQFPFLELTGIPYTVIQDSIDKEAFFQFPIDGGNFTFVITNSVFTLYGDDYHSFDFCLSGNCAKDFIQEYENYKLEKSTSRNLSVQERKQAATSKYNKERTKNAAEKVNSGEKSFSWNAAQRGNKKWERIDDCAAQYSDLYNRLGQPIDLQEQGLQDLKNAAETVNFSDCVFGVKQFPEKPDSAIVLDKNDPVFVNALYGVAFAQAHACLNFCRDPQRSGKNSKGEIKEYNVIDGMYIPDSSGFSPIINQLLTDIRLAAMEFTKESWISFNAYSGKSRNGNFLYDSDGLPMYRVINRAAFDAWNKKIEEVTRKDAVIIGDGWDVVQEAAMTTWEQSINHGGLKYLESTETAKASGKVINNLELLSQQQIDNEVKERYKNGKNNVCFMNQWYTQEKQKNGQVVTRLETEIEAEIEVTNPMQQAFQAARQVVQKNRNYQIASGKYSYIEMYIFSDIEEEMDPIGVVLYRAGKYADLGGFSTESGKFTDSEKCGSLDYDNGKNVYTVGATDIEEMTEKLVPLNLTARQALFLQYRFQGFGYARIADAMGKKSKYAKQDVRDIAQAIQKKWVKAYGEPDDLWKYHTDSSNIINPDSASDSGKGSKDKLQSTPYFINGVKGKKRSNTKNLTFEEKEKLKLEKQRAAWAAEKEYKAQQAALIKCENTGAAKKLEPTGIHNPAAYEWRNPITGKQERRTTSTESRRIPGNRWASGIITVGENGSTYSLSIVGDNSNRNLYEFLKEESILQL